MMVRCRKFRVLNNNFSNSKLNVSDFPEHIRDAVLENYCGDDAALQGCEILEYVSSHSRYELKPNPNFVDEDTQFDDSGVYYGYILSCDVSKNRKWNIVKVLLAFDTVRIIFIPTSSSDPKNLEISRLFGCSIGGCIGKTVKLTVKNVEYSTDDVRSFVNKIEPITAQEREIIYCAADLLNEHYKEEEAV